MDMKKIQGVLGAVVGVGVIGFYGWNYYSTSQANKFVDKYNEHAVSAQTLQSSINDDGTYNEANLAKVEAIADEMINTYCGKLKKSESTDMCKKLFTAEKNMFKAVKAKNTADTEKYATEVVSNSTIFEKQLTEVEKISMQ